MIENLPQVHAKSTVVIIMTFLLLGLSSLKLDLLRVGELSLAVGANLSANLNDLLAISHVNYDHTNFIYY